MRPSPGEHEELSAAAQPDPAFPDPPADHAAEASDGEDAGAEMTAAPAATQACPSCGTVLDVSALDPLTRVHCPACGTGLEVRRQFGNFAITGKLGEGGMGAVFKATDVNLQRPVALKLLRREFSADPEYIAKLEDEARITASINHPHVVKVFSSGEDGGQCYLALELVDKGSLDDLMQLQGRVAEIQVLQVGRQVAEGLKAAHEAGLIHRDVKPGNILFADARTAKITDFGLALLAEHEAESRGEIWGTPYYIAPEKLNGQPEDFRSDIYSLGGTLFHAVAGRPPFEAPDATLVALKHLKSQVVSLQAFAPDVAPETAYVINRMLHKDPGERYQSYEELIEHLQYAADQLAARAARPRAPKQRVEVESEKTRSLAGLLTLALLVLLLIGGGLAFLFRDRLFHGNAPAGSPGRAAEARKAEQARNAASAQSVEELYQEARQQLVKEQFANAQAGFSALLGRQGLTRPQADWVRLHLGMAALLNRQPDDADAAFAAELKAGPFSKEPAELPLANFFEETAKFLATPQKAISGGAVRQFKKDGVEAFSLLLFGLKDWELGVMDDAARLLQAFLDGKPDGANKWISDYAPLAAKRVQDHQLYAGLREKLKGATAAESQAALLREFDTAKGQLQTSGKIVELMDSAATGLKDKLNATRKEETSSTLLRQATQNDEDKSRWQANREVAQSALRVFRFDEALATLNNIQLRGNDFLAARDVLRERVRRLVEFKKTFIADLNARGGYPQPVSSRASVTFPKGILRADPDNLHAGSAYGEVRLAWTDLEPKALLGIARFLAEQVPDPKAAAERRWLAAAFAQEFGLAAEARALAESAAKDRPELRGQLQQFQSP